MTKQEAQQKSKEKIKAIEVLCKQLEITITAEQIITEQGFIKQTVFYNDGQNYDIDEEKPEGLKEPSREELVEPPRVSPEVAEEVAKANILKEKENETPIIEP